ncbi:hypothetical protein QTH89_21590 [Variovorax sp. J22G21]|uniref:hypothetical protein n=1 Tax=Variovorax fucosicus TaxID=3053517 RepID=UPI002578F4B4|nr:MULTISPECIES: hypothetical protein [unclassified Variovorax]MDM0039042.1 hypothetical protein [Variovorax sp. J22R193]MDM0063818.1 hypothetical protein [Variovorax sp. J22G21]
MQLKNGSELQMPHEQRATMDSGLNMGLASRAHAERCVAIVDSNRRSRRRVSSVVNRLGHMPVAFQDAQALRAHGVRGLRAEHGWMLRAIARCGYELQEPVRDHLPELHG